MNLWIVNIINGAAQTAAYDADRRPERGEARRKLYVWAETMSHLNGAVQERMGEAGFERNDWKILDWMPISGDDVVGLVRETLNDYAVKHGRPAAVNILALHRARSVGELNQDGLAKVLSHLEMV